MNDFFATIGSAFSSNIYIVVIIAVVLLLFWILGIRFVPNNKVGIVEKIISKNPNKGTIIALDGETGFQPELLRGGIHIRPRFFYKIHKEDLITIAQGEIGYVFARDGLALDPSQTLGRTVECDTFENVRLFLKNGGQKGPQRSILREGTYALNLAQFIVITEDKTHYMPLNLPGEREEIEKMSKLIEEREGFYAQVISREKKDDEIGIVTVHDGPPIKNGELIAGSVEGHNMFQDPQEFIDNGGQRGRQLDVLTDGTYFINVLFATIEKIKKTEIPIGQVGVVNYFTGEEGNDVSGEQYQHGDLVPKGKKGVWVDVLSPNKYPWNPYAGKIYLVPVTNFILKWERNIANDFGYDEKLQEITLITKDAFQPALPLSVVIHINYHDAPKVIQRFGDIRTLVEETIDPLVGAYFKNIGQTKTLLELIQDRSDIQEKAASEMKGKFAEYDLNLVEVLIGTPRQSNDDQRINDIYTQLQDRQLAKEESTTLEAKKQTEEKKREFAKAQKAAEMQADLTSSEMEITIVENRGKAEVQKAEQDAIVLEKQSRAAATKKEIDAGAEAKKIEVMANAEARREKIDADAKAYTIQAKAKANAESINMEGEANANANARKGIAEGIAVSEKVNALGANNLVQIETYKSLADAIKEFNGDLVPKSVITMGGAENGESSHNFFELLLLKFLDPNLLKNISDFETTQSETTKALAERLRKDVMEKATSDGNSNTSTEIDETEEDDEAEETSIETDETKETDEVEETLSETDEIEEDDEAEEISV